MSQQSCPLSERKGGLVTPILQAWESAGREGLAYYPAGSWGPTEADRFIQGAGRTWVNP